MGLWLCGFIAKIWMRSRDQQICIINFLICYEITKQIWEVNEHGSQSIWLGSNFDILLVMTSEVAYVIQIIQEALHINYKEKQSWAIHNVQNCKHFKYSK